MIKIGVLFIGVSFLLSSCGLSKNKVADFDSELLTYSITPSLKGDQPYISVSFQVKADENGHIQLGYPNNDWGEVNLFNSLIDFKADKKIKSEFQEDRNQVYIWGEPNEVYAFSYKIIQDFDAAPKSENTYRPIVSQDYFHILGKNLLMLPYGYFGSEEVPKAINIKWNTPRRGFSLVNSFGEEKEQSIMASYHEIYSSIFIGGNISSIESVIKLNKVVFATTDKWEHIDTEKAAKDLSSIIEQQRNFWDDHSTKLQTVTLIKTFEDCPEKQSCNNSISGTALTNSFAAFCSDNWMSSNDRMNWLFAHELFHNWVGLTIQNESEEKEYWFSEGFTDYYAYKLLVRSGMMSLDRFVEKVNEEVIQPHYSAPNKDRPNIDITGERFWSDRMWEKLPYRRGWLYAFYLDAQIKMEHSDKSLDDVMHKIMEITQKEKIPFNEDVFHRAVEPFLSSGYSDDFHQFIQRGNPIELNLIEATGLYFEKGDIPLMHVRDDLETAEVINFIQR